MAATATGPLAAPASRAEADEQAPDALSESTAQEVVVVRLGGCRYALPMDHVDEVGRPPGLTRVPGVPGWVAGVANWRGRVLAVLDLRPLLGGDAPTSGREGRLVVLSRGPVTVGLLTEGVDGTRWLDLDALEPVLAHLPGDAGSLLLGQVTDADGPCGVVDLEALLGLAEALPRPRRSG